MTTLMTEELKAPGYERVVYAGDPRSGLRAIIAVHSTALGPACGGIRMLPYASRDEALQDVLRLAKGMSYKSSLAGIGFGGGKAVIIGDPSKKSKDLFHSFGRFVESLGGDYIAAKDMNISSDDLLQVKEATKHVLGIEGVEGSSGDPSPVTAHGIFRALEATAEELKGTRSLAGLKVAVQGVGYVGYDVARRVREAGGEVWVCDIDPISVEKARVELGAKPVAVEDIYDVECDVFSPSARGAILNEKTIPRLKCRAVCGAANNQLATEEDGHRIHKRGILYAPDYAANSGGIINIFIELDGYSEKKALAKADSVYGTIREIYRRSKAENTPTFLVADRMAEERLRAGR